MCLIRTEEFCLCAYEYIDWIHVAMRRVHKSCVRVEDLKNHGIRDWHNKTFLLDFKAYQANIKKER
jgi:hypothetical protein